MLPLSVGSRIIKHSEQLAPPPCWLLSLFGFLIGMGSGVNVRTAHALGSGNRQHAEETVHSALILLCMVMGLLVGAVCFFFSGGMLKLLHTKDDLIGQASLYLKIYAIGLPAMGVYNFGNGVLSARGDTKRPLYYLAFAAGVLNVILNLFFRSLYYIWLPQVLLLPLQSHSMFLQCSSWYICSAEKMNVMFH